MLQIREMMMRTSALSKAVNVEPDSAGRASAAVVASAVRAPRGSLLLQLPDGTTIPLPHSLVEILRASAGELAEGHAVTVLPSDVALSPAEAAQLLGLSRPFVVRLLDEGEIASVRLPHSRHRRIMLADILAFQARRERRREGRKRIAAVVEDTGLPY